MTAAPNAELAYRVLDHIDAHPEQWQQGVWIDQAAACGTVACFAGWACLLSDERIPVDPGGAWVGDHAAKLLRIDGRDLFEGGNTREDLGELVEDIFGPRPGGVA